MSLKNKNILITGAAVRLGRKSALTLAEAGANIAVHYHSSKKDALSLKNELQDLGVRAEIFCLNLKSLESRAKENSKKFISSVLKEFKTIDMLINNAAIYYPTPYSEMSEKDWNAFMTINLKAPVFLAQSIFGHFKKRRRGKVINITDIAGDNPFERHLPYSIAKAGLISATKSLAKEMAPYVQVNAVSPGPILEPPQGLTRAQKKKIVNRTLLKRMGSDFDIAHAVKYLAESDYVTGEILKVDGGKSLCTA